jgi:hypothetical protein
MEFYFLNWVQFFCDFGKVVPLKEKFAEHHPCLSPKDQPPNMKGYGIILPID